METPKPFLIDQLTREDVAAIVHAYRLGRRSLRVIADDHNVSVEDIRAVLARGVTSNLHDIAVGARYYPVHLTDDEALKLRAEAATPGACRADLTLRYAITEGTLDRVIDGVAPYEHLDAERRRRLDASFRAEQLLDVSGMLDLDPLPQDTADALGALGEAQSAVFECERRLNDVTMTVDAFNLSKELTRLRSDVEARRDDVAACLAQHGDLVPLLRRACRYGRAASLKVSIDELRR